MVELDYFAMAWIGSVTAYLVYGLSYVVIDAIRARDPRGVGERR